jgi:hypothetical protein
MTQRLVALNDLLRRLIVAPYDLEAFSPDSPRIECERHRPDWLGLISKQVTK